MPSHLSSLGASCGTREGGTRTDRPAQTALEQRRSGNPLPRRERRPSSGSSAEKLSTAVQTSSGSRPGHWHRWASFSLGLAGKNSEPSDVDASGSLGNAGGSGNVLAEKQSEGEGGACRWKPTYGEARGSTGGFSGLSSAPNSKLLSASSSSRCTDRRRRSRSSWPYSSCFGAWRRKPTKGRRGGSRLPSPGSSSRLLVELAPSDSPETWRLSRSAQSDAAEGSMKKNPRLPFASDMDRPRSSSPAASDRGGISSSPPAVVTDIPSSLPSPTSLKGERFRP
mmetsp:Transcript_66744/g.208806  ORF Transcript_66744/g.208806 Transcript_66744/m.208806 type:complete len:281 (+) Transcript_66744:836-1678(+)